MILSLNDDVSFYIHYGFLCTLHLQATNQPYPYKSNCGTKKLKYSAKYSAESCVYECHTAFITELCKCRFYQFPGNKAIFFLFLSFAA